MVFCLRLTGHWFRGLSYELYNVYTKCFCWEDTALRATLLKNTSRRGISKIARLKTGHSMLKDHKSKIDTETYPQNAKWRIEHHHSIDDLLGKCDLSSQDAIIVRKKVEDFILATGNEI